MDAHTDLENILTMTNEWMAVKDNGGSMSDESADDMMEEVPEDEYELVANEWESMENISTGIVPLMSMSEKSNGDKTVREYHTHHII